MKKCWPYIRLILFAFIIIAFWGLFFKCYLKLFDKIPCLPNTNANLDVTSIVLGAVAAFAGLLIPLHYALTLDIIGKIRDSNSCIDTRTKKIENKDKELLLRYCHTSDIVVFTTAIFGVSSLVVSAFTVGLNFEIINSAKFCEISKWIGITYFGIIITSIVISISKAREEWRLDFLNESFIRYILFICFIGILSMVWGLALIYLNSADGVAFLAIIVISLFYFLWLLLRIVFTPMSRVAAISLFKENR